MYIYIYTHTQARSVNLGQRAGSAGTESRSSPRSVTRADGVAFARSSPRSYLKYYASIGVLLLRFPFPGSTVGIIAHGARCVGQITRDRIRFAREERPRVWRARFCPDNSEYCTTKTKTHYESTNMCKKKKRVLAVAFLGKCTFIARFVNGLCFRRR